jgi:hypothetical protein
MLLELCRQGHAKFVKTVNVTCWLLNARVCYYFESFLEEIKVDFDLSDSCLLYFVH